MRTEKNIDIVKKQNGMETCKEWETIDYINGQYIGCHQKKKKTPTEKLGTRYQENYEKRQLNDEDNGAWELQGV